MDPSPITVYWRPGCPFCASLLRRLERAGLRFERVDIWSDPEAAAVVRAVADGNETVPTVRIGTRYLVNPRPRQVLELAAVEAPGSLPAGDASGAQPARRTRFGRMLGR